MNWKKKVEVEIGFEQEDIDDIMSTIIEGDIYYWCGGVEIPEDEELLGEFISDQLSRGGHLTFKMLYPEDFGFNSVTISLEHIMKAFDKWVIWNTGRQYGCGYVNENGMLKIDLCSFDSVCADVLIQYALFNDIVYG